MSGTWRALAAALAVGLASGSAGAPAPAPLSADQSPPQVDSTYGSGSFGSWTVDGAGLPVFRYDLDQQVDPRARQPELSGATSAQHQVGNDHIVAAAFNDGYVQLWSQDRLSQWANLYRPDERHYAGGFGWLAVDGQVLSTLYPDRPAGTSVPREFGVGYFRKSLVAAGVTVEQVVYAPFGDDPLLLDDVTITNDSATAKQVTWFEYWDVGPYDQGGQVRRGVGQPVWDPALATLSVTQSGGRLADADPLSLFAATIDGPVEGFETSLDTFFGNGSRAAPAEVVANHLSNTLAPASAAGAPSGTVFVFRSPVFLGPGDHVRLRYAYGIAHPGQIAGLVTSYRAHVNSLATSRQAWLDWLPRADFGPKRRWVARELMWDAYLLRSASVYEEVCGHHTVTQGGYYEYYGGANLGFRSWPHYLLPLAHTAPELAREILRYSISLQPQVGGQFAYGTGALCTLVDLGSSGDLDFWLLLAAVEYGLASRDRAFFDEQLPFYDTHQTASAWTHLKLAYEHQETLRGVHGGYLPGSNGDWSDFSTHYLGMTESTLITAQLAYVYPRLVELAERLGDGAFAATVRARVETILPEMRGQFTTSWYARGWNERGQIGVGAIFGEPQPWAILAGVPERQQSIRLVRAIRRFLGGFGAPAVVHGPTRIGSSLTPAANDPDVTEHSIPFDGVGDNNSNYIGGVWFDVNGWLTWALGELDGTVPKARRFAWDEYTRNTLANHATQFPDHWAGTISIDDACWSYYSSAPERCGIPLFDQYDGQITEQPTWMVMNAIRLGGITPTRDGYRIAPHLPFGRFALRFPQVGIAAGSHRLRGYIRPEETGPLELRVRVPSTARSPRTWAGGRKVSHRRAGRFVVFTLDATAHAPADWAVTW